MCKIFKKIIFGTFLLLPYLVRPMCSNISMHTDFIVHAESTIFLPNRGERVCIYFYAQDFPKTTIFPKRTHCCVAP